MLKGGPLSSLDLHIDGPVARLTLNRPEKRNAIDDATRAALEETLGTLDADDAVRVVVLTGAGTAFCAGADLSAAAVAPTPAGRPRLVAPFETFAKPIIVAVNGVAVGGGLEIVLCCDIRIASTAARFGLPEVRIGSLPGSGGTQRLPLAIAPALAAQMILTGEPISAERAFGAGLVSELCEPERLIDRAMEIAAAVASSAPLSVKAAKRALRAATDERIAAGLALERALFDALAQTEDREEGRRAFRERRPPQFRGK
jgi:enoyl-CoA hydratase/carnithine racemase